MFGLLGPNGSGKTSTMAMLLGLVMPTSGTFRLFGLEAAKERDRALTRVGAVVETPAFYPYLSGRANLQYFQGITHKRDPGTIERLLELVGLKDRSDGKFRTYSMGMKQRLGIAAALLGDPELLILDEPTNGLDPAGMAEVRELIRSLGRQERTVMLSSHLLHEVEQVCDQIAILSKGRLIAQGPVPELLHARGRLRIRTTDDGKAAGLIRSSFPWVVDVAAPNGYLVVTAPPERSWELTAALAQAGVYISEMAPTQTSLEDYFLEVTAHDATREVPR